MKSLGAYLGQVNSGHDGPEGVAQGSVAVYSRRELFAVVLP